MELGSPVDCHILTFAAGLRGLRGSQTQVEHCDPLLAVRFLSLACQTRAQVVAARSCAIVLTCLKLSSGCGEAKILPTPLVRNFAAAGVPRKKSMHGHTVCIATFEVFILAPPIRHRQLKLKQLINAT